MSEFRTKENITPNPITNETQGNRVLIFLHFNHKENEIAEYVIYWLTYLRPLYKKIIFVSNSDIDKKEHLINKFSDRTIVRKNVGFDFAGWKEAIFAEGWERLSQYDNLTLLNDTCFGPMFDWQNYYNEMEHHKSDFWGNTNHRALYSNSLGCFIPEHIQSYFIVFNKQVIKSYAFQSFWENVKNEVNVLDVIRNYEIQLTSKLIEAGFSYKVWIDTTTEKYQDFHPNLAHIYPFVMLDKHSPFLKVKNLTELNINFSKLERHILNCSKYPTYLMSPRVNKTERRKDNFKSIIIILCISLYRVALPSFIKNSTPIKKMKNHVKWVAPIQLSQGIEPSPLIAIYKILYSALPYQFKNTGIIKKIKIYMGR